MKERDKQQHNEEQHEPYWQFDEAISEAEILGERYGIRLRLHTSTERYSEREELVPLTHRRGERIYLHARPYILVPEIRLTIGVYDQPKGEAIGKVTDSQWTGMEHREIGNCQGWTYPADKTAVLWEAYLFDHYRAGDNPSKDEALKVLWIGFERILLERSRGAARIVVPSWEPEYPDNWQDFLRAQGYQPFNEQAFAKEVARP